MLEEIGTLLEIQGENRFKARAFMGAARAVEKIEEDLGHAGARRSRWRPSPGIGPATASVIRELINTGTSLYYRDLRERTPDSLLALLAVPRLGATRIRTLHDELGIRSVDDLERAARGGRIAKLKGFGPRTEQHILEGIEYVRGIDGRRRYAYAIELATRLRGFAATLPGVTQAELAGELRRGCETVSAIDVVVALEPGQARAAIRHVSGAARRERCAQAGRPGRHCPAGGRTRVEAGLCRARQRSPPACCLPPAPGSTCRRSPKSRTLAIRRFNLTGCAGMAKGFQPKRKLMCIGHWAWNSFRPSCARRP